jgi:hypothetical protein
LVRPTRNVASTYIFYQPDATPFLDIYALGLVFLSMLHRSSLSAPWYIHIKYEITTCTVYPRQVKPPFKQDHHYCTPAHVLLCHRLSTTNPTLQMKARAQYDLYTALNSDVHSKGKVRQYNDVVELRERKVIDDEMYNLLDAMTTPASTTRIKLPDIHKCIQVIQSCIQSSNAN